MTFADLGVPAPLVDVLSRAEITTPTPIQTATLPDSLAGRDVLGRGRTGSGKTYAFLLPVIARLASPVPTGGGRVSPPRRIASSPRAMILVPTRELAGQVDAALAPLARAMGLTSLTVFGGVGQNPQVTALRRGIDILIACPGRLEDLISQGVCRLDQVEITVLDEADHMSDLGFLPGVKRLLDRTPRTGQRLLFSATLDAGVDVIVKRYLTNPVTHHADSAQSPVTSMTHHVLEVDREQRMPVLVDLTAASRRTLVFTRTKHGAKQLARKLNDHGVASVELHGNLAQNARTRNLAAFHSGAVTTLVATDIAARGIHVDDIELVIHADPPAEHKAYLHRSGRTARAGAKGTVVTIMHRDQAQEVRALTRAAGIKATTTAVSMGHPFLAELVPGERRFQTMAALPSREIPVGSVSGRGAANGRGGSSSSDSADRPGRRARRGSSSSTAPRPTARAGGAPTSGAPSRSGGPARGAAGSRNGASPAGTWSAARVSEQRGGGRRSR